MNLHKARRIRYGIYAGIAAPVLFMLLMLVASSVVMPGRLIRLHRQRSDSRPDPKSPRSTPVAPPPDTGGLTKKSL